MTNLNTDLTMARNSWLCRLQYLAWSKFRQTQKPVQKLTAQLRSSFQVRHHQIFIPVLCLINRTLHYIIHNFIILFCLHMPLICTLRHLGLGWNSTNTLDSFLVLPNRHHDNQTWPTLKYVGSSHPRCTVQYEILQVTYKTTVGWLLVVWKYIVKVENVSGSVTNKFCVR